MPSPTNQQSSLSPDVKMEPTDLPEQAVDTDRVSPKIASQAVGKDVKDAPAAATVTKDAPVAAQVADVDVSADADIDTEAETEPRADLSLKDAAKDKSGEAQSSQSNRPQDTPTTATRAPKKRVQSLDSTDGSTAVPAASSTTLSTVPASSTPSRTIMTTYQPPKERRLPGKDVTQENMAQRYIEFIFYCNPSAPLETDMSALLRAFHAVPKSDGKQFDPWHLYQLVAKHLTGEIKTWTKLAQQLGVERTDDSSPQKIQQYAVRLKKWMRSIHIDAFFDYVLSIPNQYYLEPNKNPTGAEGEDEEIEDADLVLKLIKRANSKRKKRKYTRRNTVTAESNDANGSASRGRDGEHPEKRLKVTFSEHSSDGSAGHEDDDADDNWDTSMDVDPGSGSGGGGSGGGSGSGTGAGGRDVRRRSIVQVGVGPRWVKDEDEDDHVMQDGGDVSRGGAAVAATAGAGAGGSGGAKAIRSNRRRQYPTKYPAREILLQLGKSNGGSSNSSMHHIPTPNPSPTTQPEMRHPHAEGDSGRSGGRAVHGTQLRWRNISIGGGPAASSGATTSSPSRATFPIASSSATSSSPQKGLRRKSGEVPGGGGHFDTFRVQHPHKRSSEPHVPTTTAATTTTSPMASGSTLPTNPGNWNWPSTNDPLVSGGGGGSSSGGGGGGGGGSPPMSFPELLIPPTVPNGNDAEMIVMLQQRLVKAVGLLEASQKRIDMLETVVRQRDDEVRKRVVRVMRDDVVELLKRWET